MIETKSKLMFIRDSGGSAEKEKNLVGATKGEVESPVAMK